MSGAGIGCAIAAEAAKIATMTGIRLFIDCLCQSLIHILIGSLNIISQRSLMIGPIGDDLFRATQKPCPLRGT